MVKIWVSTMCSN